MKERTHGEEFALPKLVWTKAYTAHASLELCELIFHSVFGFEPYQYCVEQATVGVCRELFADITDGDLAAVIPELHKVTIVLVSHEA